MSYALSFYRLYITYTLSGFLFDLDQSNVCKDIQKIKLIRKCIEIPQKTYNTTKRLKTPEEEVEHYFPDFIAFTDCTEQQQQQQMPKPEDKIRCKACILFRQEEKTYGKESACG